MVVVFVRHGERRGGESDPGLTSGGRRMAFETGQWLASQGIQPTAFWTTPTARTRQTAAELALGLSSSAPHLEQHLPEDRPGWEALLSRLWAGYGAQQGTVVCVGHHPTVDLLRSVYPRTASIPRANYACAVVMEGQPGLWQCVATWPGRP